MRKLFFGLMAATLLSPALSTAADLTIGEKDTIFISDLKIQSSVLDKAIRDGRSMELRRAFETLESQFTTALSATRVFQLVERKDLQTVTKEQEFVGSGMVETDNRVAAQSGKLLGAKFVFIPVIDAFEDISHTQSYQAIGRSEVTRNLYLSAVVKIVDTTTGVLLPDAPSIQLKKTEVNKNVQFGQVVGGEELVVSLAKELAQRLCHETVAMLRPAKVLSVTGKQILINRGLEAGFNLGDQVEIYAIESIKDEDSGESFRNEIPVGQAKIVRIDKKQSFAMINGDDLGIAKGCIVKVFINGAEQNTNLDRANSSPDQQSPGSSEKPLKW